MYKINPNRWYVVPIYVKREAAEHIKNVLYGRLLDKNNRNDDGMDMANVGGNRPDFPRWWDDELKKALALLQGDNGRE